MHKHKLTIFQSGCILGQGVGPHSKFVDSCNSNPVHCNWSQTVKTVCSASLSFIGNHGLANIASFVVSHFNDICCQDSSK